MKSVLFQRINWAIVALTAVLCTSCTPKSGGSYTDTAADADSLMATTHAELFSVEYHKDYKKAVVMNPWQKGEVLNVYYLVRDDSVSTPDDGVKVSIPFKKVAAGSCCHVAFIDNLNLLKTVAGVCSPMLIYNPEIRRMVENGECADLGDSFSINFEPTLMVAPDAVFATSFNQIDPYMNRVREAGIKTVNTVEWMEPDILGRSEWLKFVAAFYDKESMADSIFSRICTDFDSLRAITAGVEHRPTVLPGLTFKGTWYMPAGKSYMNRLFDYAGADYYFKNDTTEGSFPLSFEFVMSNFKDCDVWVGLDLDTYSELAAADSRLTEFKAYKNRNAFNNNKRKNATGGNDFWENGFVHPEWILKDLIIAFHPELMAGEETYFIKKLTVDNLCK